MTVAPCCAPGPGSCFDGDPSAGFTRRITYKCIHQGQAPQLLGQVETPVRSCIHGFFPNNDMCEGWDTETWQPVCEEYVACDGTAGTCGVLGMCCERRVSGVSGARMTERGCSTHCGGQRSDVLSSKWLQLEENDIPAGCVDICTGACCDPATCACTQGPAEDCPAGFTFHPCKSCSQNPCQPGGCCGCDWCCDRCGDQSCHSIRQFSWENAPRFTNTACFNTLNCPVSPPRPICRRAEFAIGRRPQAHEPPCTTPDPTNRLGRHEMHSLTAIRARDLRTSAAGTDRRCNTSTAACDRDPECRIYYGHVGQAGSSRTIGWLCGHENRCKLTGVGQKLANQCYPNKREDGRHSFECAYRSPCPEKPAVCTA